MCEITREPFHLCAYYIYLIHLVTDFLKFCATSDLLKTLGKGAGGGGGEGRRSAGIFWISPQDHK